MGQCEWRQPAERAPLGRHLGGLPPTCSRCQFWLCTVMLVATSSCRCTASRDAEPMARACRSLSGGWFGACWGPDEHKLCHNLILLL